MTRAFLLVIFLAAGGCTTVGTEPNEPFSVFLDRVDSAQLELQHGRPDAYKALWSRRPDVTLAGGFGGNFEQGWDRVSQRLEWASSQFKSGRSEIERIASSTSGSLGYLVQTEHLYFTSATSNTPVERRYRVTMLFRQEDGQRRIIHRHADTQNAKEAPR